MFTRIIVPLGILCILGAVVVTQLPGASPEASAASESQKIKDAVTVINSDVAYNVKLQTLQVLKKLGGSEVVKALVKLAASKDKRVSALACTTLARLKTDAATTELKKIILDGKRAVFLRTSAMNTMARCGNLKDRSWLESNVSKDVDLKSSLAALKKLSFWK